MPRTLTIRSTRVHQGVWLLGFEQIPDRTGAESLRGTRLVIDAADARSPAATTTAGTRTSCAASPSTPPTEPGSVRSTRLEIGPAQDLLVVALDAGGDAYLPFVEAIVPEVDVEGGRVVVDPPEGLLELNA